LCFVIFAIFAFAVRNCARHIVQHRGQ
jgi:hypothetical protein